MTTSLSRAHWRKSSHSSQDGNCVEIATNLPGTIAVRDSKNPNGPTLTFTPTQWQTFTTSTRACFPR